MKSDRPICVKVTPTMLHHYGDEFQALIDAGVQIEFNTHRYPMPAHELAEFLGDAQLAIIGLDEVSALVFEKCPHLAIIARNGVGLDNVDLEAASAHGVIITAPYGANSISVAELTFGLLLAVQRGIVATHNRVQQGIWKREIGVELAGKTLGIIGLGRIGKQVARRALAFEMTVIANDIAPDMHFAAAHGIEYVSLDDLLRSADVVSLHVPLTPLTQHMINAQRLRMMRRHAVLINTARGAVLDAPALAQALDDGIIAGAGLDVHTVEGQVEDCLTHRDNLVTTTHLGAYTHDSLRKTTRAAVRSLLQVLHHQQPDDRVNPEASAARMRESGQ